MDTKQSKQISLIILVVAVTIGFIVVISGASTPAEERVNSIQKEIRDIREEVEALEDSDLSPEKRQEAAARLERELEKYEEELRALE